MNKSYRIVQTLGVAVLAAAVAARAANPRSVSLTIQENGSVRVSEIHDLPPALPGGLVAVAPVPETILPATVTAAPLERGASLGLLSQRYAWDLADADAFFRAALGWPVTAHPAAPGAAPVSGPLAALPDLSSPAPQLLVEARQGLALVPDLTALARVEFASRPDTAREPTLLWTLDPSTPAPPSVQLNYAASGLSWEASHDAILSGDARSVALSTRVRIHNGTSRAFDRATVRLSLTEKGRYAPLVPDAADPRAAAPVALRYAEDGRTLVPERTAASAAVTVSYDLPAALSIPARGDVWATLADFPALPVETVLRYDGARFDRFNRNRRADPEYGAGSSSVVETRLALRNAGKVPLPPGPFRVLRGDPSVPLEWVGTDWLPALAPGESVTLRLGPAAGLSGRRERKAFTETEPLKAAEESFEISVANQTPFDRTVEVLEHLYRGDRWEIAAASAPYEPGPVPDSIVFRLPVKAGAERTVTYTVRYAW